MQKSLSVHTFGCRLNQLESESLAEAFAASGFSLRGLASSDQAPEPGPAGFYLFNTCTVTSKAEQKARRLIRQALSANPQAVILVTGCYAQMDAEALAELGERVVVLPGSRKDILMDLPAKLAAMDGGHQDPLDLVKESLAELEAGLGGVSGGKLRGDLRGDPFRFAPTDFRFHSRASLKVEEGCDNDCAYCRVHLARGPAQSLDPAVAVERARALELAGFAEIVLSGVNLSQYRHSGLGFPQLVQALLAGTEGVAFRISSYEPDRVDQDFIRLIADPRVRPFFHLPVQSGSAATLERMGRRPDPQQMLHAMGELRRVKADPFISLDMICGFPGESQAEFEESLAFARAADPAWIHVFSYSARPDTRAQGFSHRVPERIAVERAALLTDIAREGRAAYAKRSFGRSLRAVLERGLSTTPTESSAILGEAFTENALRVALIAAEPEQSLARPLPARRGADMEVILMPPPGSDFDAAAFVFDPR